MLAQIKAGRQLSTKHYLNLCRFFVEKIIIANTLQWNLNEKYWDSILKMHLECFSQNFRYNNFKWYAILWIATKDTTKPYIYLMEYIVLYEVCHDLNTTARTEHYLQKCWCTVCRFHISIDVVSSVEYGW